MSHVLEHAPVAAAAASLGAGGITLTDGQMRALEGFTAFLMDPDAKVFVIQGFSGTGKSTLVETIMERMDQLKKMVRLMDPNCIDYQVDLTATTNKAAENFSRITGREVPTIHSYLGLRVQTNYSTGETTLVPSNKAMPEQRLVFIDEASYVDSALLGFVFSRTRNCKIVFMGDPAQLAPVKSAGTPVFDAGFTTVKLTEVVRQAEGNPIIDLATKFRQAVETGQFFSFTPDGHHIQHMDRQLFNQHVLAEFTRPDWKYQDSKFLSWTNKCAIDYNHAIRDAAKGDPNFQEGDYAICNKFIANGKRTIKTDQLVCITRIEELTESYGIPGHYFTIDGGMRVFGPSSLAQWKAVVKQLQTLQNESALSDIDRNWIDLRAAYGQTINKSQGSTYNKVYIDLDDIGRCTNGNTLARMLYVGVSRARHQVFLTGDLV